MIALVFKSVVLPEADWSERVFRCGGHGYDSMGHKRDFVSTVMG